MRRGVAKATTIDYLRCLIDRRSLHNAALPNDRSVNPVYGSAVWTRKSDAIVFYGWGPGIAATATARNINSALERSLPSALSTEAFTPRSVSFPASSTSCSRKGTLSAVTFTRTASETGNRC